MSEPSRRAREQSGAPATCPRCGEPGRPVHRITVAAIVPGPLPPDDSYHLCRGPGCPALYFGSGGDVIEVAATEIRPAFKDVRGDGTLCHCFLIDRADLEAAARRGDADRLLDRVQAAMAAGRCACRVRHPAGSCCLGELRQAVARCTSADSDR